MTLPSIQALLKKHNIRAKKSFSQNFLTPTPTLEKIIQQLDPQPSDLVIEIGPGLGLMTAMLAKKVKRVIAIEYDPTMLEIAQAEFAEIKNIDWIHADFLEYNLQDLKTVNLKIIGNIPYEITSPILFKLLDNKTYLKKAILLMQKEVAKRIVAIPNCKDYGILAVRLQAEALCTKCFDVSAKSFIPAPKVDSSVVKIEYHNNFPQDENNDLLLYFRQLVKAAFAKRRKTLRNALLGSRLNLGAEKLDTALARLQIEQKRRAESLSIEEFKRLAKELFSP